MSNDFIVETDEKGNTLYIDKEGELNRVAFQEGGQAMFVESEGNFQEMLVEQDGNSACYRIDGGVKFVKDNEGNTINYFTDGETVSSFTDKDGNEILYEIDGKILAVRDKEGNSSQYLSDKMVEQTAVMQKKASKAAKNAESIKENGWRLREQVFDLRERVFDEFWNKEPNKGSVKDEMKNQAMSSRAGVENPKAVAQGIRYDLRRGQRMKEVTEANESAKERLTKAAELIKLLKMQNGSLRD